MKTTFIYALCEPGTRTVRYIGKADKPKKRLREHLLMSIKLSNHLGCWLRSLRVKEMKPELIVLREVLVEKNQEAERRYIRLARGLGMDLTNSTDGGEGCLNPSEESRKKMRAAQAGSNHPNFGRVLPEEHRKNIGDSLRGRKKSAAHCEAIRAGKKGWIPTPQQIAANSAAHTGKPLSSKHCAAISAGMRGKKFTHAHCENIGAAKKGRKLSPEHCASIGNSKRGLKASEETRAKMSASGRARWAIQKQGVSRDAI